ncbi:hypothetical protein TRFO_14444 [Tritrichomonas foetus]|uniref:Uncharacterized protein n=1 Tax=Tritrichomonas foetus TaxID=1144522 RepID=A0A1J4KZG0_9EUKA|nr:hypothetical protein TRFO_14444 [Tritrichomonas foetus]|eukprot:OHT15094.1 hypothetical protein TRFO_14444 [Tritrichomonas foetus]
MAIEYWNFFISLYRIPLIFGHIQSSKEMKKRNAKRVPHTVSKVTPAKNETPQQPQPKPPQNTQSEKKTTPTKSRNKNRKKALSFFEPFTSKHLVYGTIVAFLYIQFLYEMNFKYPQYSITPLPSENPLASMLDKYSRIYCDSIQPPLSISSLFCILWVLLVRMQCDIELSFLYCLVILLDPSIFGHTISSFSTILHELTILLSIFSFLTLFKPNWNKKIIWAFFYFAIISGSSLVIRAESLPIFIVFIISILIKALYRMGFSVKFAKFCMTFLVIELAVIIILSLIFGFPSTELAPSNLIDFLDEVKIFDFHFIFSSLCIISIFLFFFCRLNIFKKTIILVMIASIVAELIIPIQTCDDSPQIRLFDAQTVSILITGMIFCKPTYFGLSGIILFIYIICGWLIRYYYEPVF